METVKRELLRESVTKDEKNKKKGENEEKEGIEVVESIGRRICSIDIRKSQGGDFV